MRNVPGDRKMGRVEYSSEPGSLGSINLRGGLGYEESNYGQDKSLIRLDDEHLVFRGSNLGPGVSKIFINGDLVTHVYDSGKVLMSPIKCLSGSQKELVEKLRPEAEEQKKRIDQEWELRAKEREQGQERREREREEREREREKQREEQYRMRELQREERERQREAERMRREQQREEMLRQRENERAERDRQRELARQERDRQREEQRRQRYW